MASEQKLLEQETPKKELGKPRTKKQKKYDSENSKSQTNTNTKGESKRKLDNAWNQLEQKQNILMIQQSQCCSELEIESRVSSTQEKKKSKRQSKECKARKKCQEVLSRIEEEDSFGGYLMEQCQ
ncbi:unnamed protein product [Paramecium octaurelia]|uniref:Uncharacterized protein n=1 Tax=Paramecium octaurelia TaxID=43137 RepID=A0A8S1WNE0_PAROT|nr:unnamed protein product [Paramecium octaurelia]